MSADPSRTPDYCTISDLLGLITKDMLVACARDHPLHHIFAQSARGRSMAIHAASYRQKLFLRKQAAGSWSHFPLWQRFATYTPTC